MPDMTGAPEEIRTPDPQIRSLVLYPTELRAPKPSKKADLASDPPGNGGLFRPYDRLGLPKLSAAQRQGWNITEI
jgi:hypothetical protein